METHQPLSIEELTDVLSLTIKADEENKIATFLCQLSAFTHDAQFNISFNAPSSSGKSYIPLEISGLFPQEDVIKIGNCSPTAFFHEQGEYNKETNSIVVDLARKIIIFLDMPHTQLLERLRSFLSHDEREMHSKITDKNQKGGNRTKTVILRGFPSVIFCSAGLRIDEQESTRFLLLSPEATPEKIMLGINQAIRKSSNSTEYEEWLNSDPRRKLLKSRILAIKQAHIGDIQICSEDLVKRRFLADKKLLKPRHQRDIKRFMALIKSIALLNYWWREQTQTGIIANEEDIEEAFKIWDKISISQEFNLPPYVYKIYKDLIVPLWKVKEQAIKEDQFVFDKRPGISRQDILQKHFDVHGRMLDIYQLRQQIIPMLETAGLVTQEQDSNDKRRWLILPAVITEEEEYGVDHGGVTDKQEESQTI